MSTTAPNEILQKWKKLQEVGEERSLFAAYESAREAYLSALYKSVKGEITEAEMTKAILAEIEAFDIYVNHRTNSTYREALGDHRKL